MNFSEQLRLDVSPILQEILLGDFPLINIPVLI